MKKTLLFFTVFLLFGFLSAEDVKTGEYDFGDVTVTLFEEREAAPEPKKVSEEEREVEAKEEPEWFYVQPALGIETGNVFFATVINLDIDFLVGRTKRKNNIYLGFDLGMTTSPIDHFYAVPIQANISFDFKQKDPNLNFVSLWMSFGINLNFWSYREHSGWMGVSTAWRTGLDIVFAKDVVIKVGLDKSPWALLHKYNYGNVRGLYLSFMVALGYRF
jgi:hypothetical protein